MFQLIGCSVLIMHDRFDKCGVWVIDFSKTNPVQDGCEITHRLPWQLGNHEDGFLFGLDNLMQVSKVWKQIGLLTFTPVDFYEAFGFVIRSSAQTFWV